MLLYFKDTKMNIENTVIESMILAPIAFVVLKDSTVAERFYNAENNPETSKLLRLDMQLYIESFSKTKLCKKKKIVDFVGMESILKKLYLKIKHRDKYFFIFKENIVSLIYIDTELFRELSIDSNLIKKIYIDNRVEINLITKMEI